MQKETIIDYFKNSLKKFQKKDFDVLLQDKTKDYLYNVGLPSGHLVWNIPLLIDGELRLKSENKIQITVPFESGENLMFFFIDCDKDDSLFLFHPSYGIIFVNSSLENFLYCLYAVEDFHDKIYSKRLFGEIDDREISEKYALHLEKTLISIDEKLTIQKKVVWWGEISDLAMGDDLY